MCSLHLRATKGSADDLAKLRLMQSKRTGVHKAIERPASKGRKSGSAQPEELARIDLEQALRRLTLAIDRGRIGIWDWDIKDDLLRWHNWMDRLYSIEHDNGVSGNELWQRHLQPDDCAAAEQAVADGRSGTKTCIASPRWCRHIFLEGHEINHTAKLGINVYPDDGSDAEILIENVDAAMDSKWENGLPATGFLMPR